MTGIEITSFLMIVLLSVNAGVYEAVGYRISPEGVAEIQFDIKNANYAHDIDLTFDIVRTMAELENQ